MVYDVDGNGAVDALSDGLLIFRYAIGYRGSALIAGAIGAGATRITVGEVEGYLQTIWWQTDAGGDGKTDYGDSLMILRYLLGFRGETLTDGCVSGGAIRDTPAQIEAYIEKMVT